MYLPSKNVPKSSNKVTDTEYDYDQSENTESIVYHDLSHDVIVVLKLIIFQVWILKYLL
jgi:hypothetical protein